MDVVRALAQNSFLIVTLVNCISYISPEESMPKGWTLQLQVSKFVDSHSRKQWENSKSWRYRRNSEKKILNVLLQSNYVF